MLSTISSRRLCTCTVLALLCACPSGHVQRWSPSRSVFARSVSFTARPATSRASVSIGADAEENYASEYAHRLAQATSYLKPHLRQIAGALRFAVEAHDGQKRQSGEPFVTHPIEVALILASLRMDAATVIAGLLHDTVEDCDHVTIHDLRTRFGNEVARIVEGETKVSKLHTTGNKQFDQRMNTRAMLLAMAEDWRIIVVKLADRLHNMRTIGHMPVHKQRRIAAETLDVFVPLARTLGIKPLEDELRQLSLRTFAHVVDVHLATREPVVNQGRTQLERMLEDDYVLRTRRVGDRLLQHRVAWHAHSLAWLHSSGMVPAF
jgi:GTP pyrophosphokinase